MGKLMLINRRAPVRPTIITSIVGAMTWVPMSLDVRRARANWDGVSCISLASDLARDASKNTALQFWRDDYAGGVFPRWFERTDTQVSNY